VSLSSPERRHKCVTSFHFADCGTSGRVHLPLRRLGFGRRGGECLEPPRASSQAAEALQFSQGRKNNYLQVSGGGQKHSMAWAAVSAGLGALPAVGVRVGGREGREDRGRLRAASSLGHGTGPRRGTSMTVSMMAGRSEGAGAAGDDRPRGAADNDDDDAESGDDDSTDATTEAEATGGGWEQQRRGSEVPEAPFSAPGVPSSRWRPALAGAMLSGVAALAQLWHPTAVQARYCSPDTARHIIGCHVNQETRIRIQKVRLVTGRGMSVRP
jgi:hypothetical protein